MKNETHSKTVVFHCPDDRKKKTKNKKQTNKQINSKNKDSDIIFPFLLPLKNILDLFTNYFLGQKFNKMDVMSCLVSMKALTEHWHCLTANTSPSRLKNNFEVRLSNIDHWVGRGSGHKRYQICGNRSVGKKVQNLDTFCPRMY